MGDYIISLEGTEAGKQLALGLALMAALLHAFFGALQKGRHDPWLSRGAIDFFYAAMAAPVALFVVPWPSADMIPLFVVVWAIHVIYKICQGFTYTLGSYTVVYPVVRGTGPLFTVFGAGLLFGEHFTWVQWSGVALLVGAIYGLALYNLKHWQVGRDKLKPALAMAVLTGLCVAAYTTIDAFGIRSTPDPFTFLAWFFMIDGLTFPIVADKDHKVAELYDMIHPNASTTAAVRSVFIIDPSKKIRLTMTYPMNVGRNFDEILRVIDALQLADAKTVATPADWRPGGKVIIPTSVSNEDAKGIFPQGWEEIRPYLRVTKVN